MAYSPISVRSHDSLDQSIPAQQPLQPCVSASEECHVPSPCSDEHHVDTLPASPPPHAPASHSSRPSSPGSVPKPVGKIRRHERRIFIWWPECLAMLGSIAFLIAIAAVLLAFHTKPLATWSMPWQIKPNTLVSILMTLCRLTMLVVVAECLSQLKWVYFQQRAHPLTHFQVFDDASRGPWGSLRLLIAVNWTAIAASFGAVITILALAMEPFTQQVLSYPVRNATERTAVLWRADAYDYGTAPQVMNVDEPFPSAPYGQEGTSTMTAAILASLSNATSLLRFDCRTGNCTWSEFPSLGVCSSCIDVSQTTKRNCTLVDTSATPIYGAQIGGRCMYTTPAGSQLGIEYEAEHHASSASAGTFTIWNSTVLTDDGSGKYRGNDLPNLAKLSSIHFEKDWFETACSNFLDAETCEVPMPRAYDCTLSFCAKTYSANAVMNGTLYDTPTREEPLELPFEPARDYPTTNVLDDLEPYDKYDICLGLNQSLWTNETTTFTNGTPTWTITGLGNGYGYDGMPSLRLAAFTPGSVPQDIDTCADYRNKTLYPHAMWINYADSQHIGQSLASLFTTELQNQDTSNLGQVLYSIHQGNFSKIMDAVATGMTNAIRQGPNGTIEYGDVVSKITVIQVNWPWLIYPATLVLLTLVFMILTFIFSAENSQVVWKSSTLAVLFHGLAGWSEEELDERTLKNLELTARTMSASLIQNEAGNLKLMRF